MGRNHFFGIVLVALAVAMSACSSGPAAPPVGQGAQACTDAFCVTIPDGWEAEVGQTYISAHHSLAPANTFLTVGVINQQALVETAGGQWPVPAADVVAAFWSLLESAGVGEFERSQRVVGGAERSWGVHEDGDMWHLLWPTSGSGAIGIEVRAPNDSWEDHADFVFASLTTN